MSGDSKTVVYEEVKAATENNDVTIVDVRESHELQKTGKIPNSINIPLAEIANVFDTIPDDEFEKKYGCPKPTESTPMIFSCGAGIRAAKAAQAVSELGYENIKVYTGSWKDWAQHL